MFGSILFDFDGTLMDTSPGIYNSFDVVMKHYGLDFPRSKYDLMIGPPLRESFVNILGLPESEVPQAIKVYRSYYGTEGLYECEVYPGLVELIEKLRAAGKKVFIATSKPEVFAKKILEKKGILGLFDFVGGSDEAESGRIEKSDVVRYVLESNGLSGNKDSCLMVGDRKYDIIGAHEAGIKCAGILWGFGSREEFVGHGADYIIESPEELLELVK